jgi:thioredoxin reductase (NADPH)
MLHIRQADPYDVIIVGAGPGGASAAIYAARAGLRTLMLDRSVMGGALARTSHIANYPGLGYREPLAGTDLLRMMREHAESLGARMVQSQVYGVELEDEEKSVVATDNVYTGRALIIATGAGSRDNKLPGEEEHLGRGVSYCATCDAAFFAGRDVVVLGNSYEAVEEAAVLARQARSVVVVTGSSRMLADKHEVDALLSRGNVSLRLQHTPLAVVGEQVVTGLRVRTPVGREEIIPADGIFVYLPGAKPATEFLENKVRLDEHGYIITNENMETSVPGVYAVGDVRGRPIRQVVLAAADGCLAALAAERYLRHTTKTTSQWHS